MTRYVLTVNLKDDPAVIADLSRLSRRVWPEVLESLRTVGVEQMDIYQLGRKLVMILELTDGLDFRRAFATHMCSSPRVAEWERLMKSLQEPSPDAPDGEWWTVMEPVFQLDAEPPSRAPPIGRALPDPDTMTDLRQAWNVPSRPRPIVIIGAGGIVRTAHLPAYQRLRLPVAGLFDINPDAAHDTARRFAVPKVFHLAGRGGEFSERRVRHRGARRSDSRRVEPPA